MSLHRQGLLLLSEFIHHHYPERVVEVACGKRSSVAVILARSLNVIATDVLESQAVDQHLRPLYVKDDITSPNLALYQNAQLLYSIRPPLEIQEDILNVAHAVYADVLIKPLDDEVTDVLRTHLRNYYGIAFYHVRADAAGTN